MPGIIVAVIVVRNHYLWVPITLGPINYHDSNEIVVQILQHGRKDYNKIQNGKLQPFLRCDDEGLTFLVVF
jgi:hypothetical protein